jgi:hypothetical protein
MAELRRLGDIINYDSEYRIGDRRIIKAYDNLGMKILFADETFGIKDFYVHSSPKKPVTFPGIVAKVSEIGDYEGSLVDKILHPQNPVICIKGRMGSGKTTTIRYVMENFIECLACDNNEGLGKKGLISWIDFKRVVSSHGDSVVTLYDLLVIVCKQLWNKSSYYFDQNLELNVFWDYLLGINDKDHDEFVEEVVSGILNSYPYLRKCENCDDVELKKREKIRDEMKMNNLQWYLKYLVLMMRYLVQTKFSDQRGCAVIVLDNVDSLSPDMQAELIKLVMKSAHSQGPTFILLVRPETFDRHGLNDDLLDVVGHKNPEPYQIVLDRLNRFLNNEERYYLVAPSLLQEEKNLMSQYLSRIIPKLKGDKAYLEFIKAIAGKSIRNALVLAQGLFCLSIGEMRKRNLTVHYIIRAMIRNGSYQYKAVENKRVANIFDVIGEIDGRFLIKMRLLRYIAGYGGSCTEPNIINAFSLFGFQDTTVTQAIIELLNHECQLLSSNGFDVFHKIPGNDQEIISITETGLGYIDHLIYNINFIQEVMLDSRVNSTFPVPQLFNDSLCDKIVAMINFLEEIHDSEVSEVKSFFGRGVANYGKIFGSKLLSLEIIQRTFDSTNRLLESQKLEKKANIDEYEEVIFTYKKLITKARLNNSSLFGVDSIEYSEIE